MEPPFFFCAILVFSFFTQSVHIFFAHCAKIPAKTLSSPRLQNIQGFGSHCCPFTLGRPLFGMANTCLPCFLTCSKFFIYVKAPPAAASCAWTPSPTHQSWGAFCRQPPGCLPVSVQCAGSLGDSHIQIHQVIVQAKGSYIKCQSAPVCVSVSASVYAPVPGLVSNLFPRPPLSVPVAA